ncbi:unnamed protein product [Prorocentrum cordatum]|uniref:Transposase Tc1-like domain-containing protein n=1 Tax=Prorocentrum cordatum TaxID=2364126 RepID=A0ABN9X4X2_9DINO|nr:unnamed protein product [Polarella glacialis]
MPVVSEMRHPKGFSFQQERRIVLLREATQSDGSHMEWSEIAKKVKNLLGKRPRPRHVANTCRRATARRGPLKYDYKKCGKKPDKVTKEVERFLVKKLKELRCRTACTSTTLQLLLASEMKVKVTVRYVRKVLSKKGFRWLPKRQKRLYSKDQRKARLTFAKKVLRMTSAELNTALAYAMDGVILAMPPKAKLMKRVCREVVRKKGAATGFALLLVMGLTGAVQARRALVKLLLTVAAAYSVVVRLHRGSQDSEVIAAFRKVLRKARPDKGGADEHAKQLNAAKERWDQMPVVSEMRHPKGFSFQQERRIVLLREATQSDGSHMEWSEIAKKVKNLLGKRPRPRHVANTCRRATARRGPLKYDYKKCGKKPDKVTKEVERFLVKKLKELRCRTACTSTTLQLLLASEMKVKVTVRYVRKVLSKKGFRWLPKRQKRLYSKDQRKARLTFAKKVLRMTSAELNTALACAMDGVILGFALLLVMGLTGAVQARRALVKLLLTVAAAYSVVVRLHRDSQDSEVIAAFRKVLRKAHPDKGGADEHAKQLNAAKECWDQAKKPRGRPKRAEQPEAPAGAAAADGAPGETFQDLIVREVSMKAYRIQSAGVLLTYFGVQGLPQWQQFLAHVRSKQKVDNFISIRHCRKLFPGDPKPSCRAGHSKARAGDAFQFQRNQSSAQMRHPQWRFSFQVRRALRIVLLRAGQKPESDVQPRGVERRIALLREATQSDGSHMEWSEIAKKVKNLLGKRPRPRHVANTYRRATARRGPLKYDYKKCGKKPDKVTKEVERFLVKKLKELRCRTACTSTTLQLLLASEMKVKVTVRYVRKVLSKKGFRWLPKRQKRLYSKDQRKARLTFAKKVLRMTSAELNTALACAMDGVILAMPPKAKLMKRVCREVVRKKGAATGSSLPAARATARAGDGPQMPVVSEMRHPKGFSFQQERRIVLLREATQSDGSHVEWSEIAKKVKNLLGKRPRLRHVANTCRRATARRRPLKYDYKKCGKKPDKVTEEVERFLVKKLKELRCRTACTSTTLQFLLASEMKVKVTVRYVRKVLSKKGFRWLPKRQKWLYSKDQRKARLTFAKKVLRMTSAELNTALACAMDGVILAMPPKAEPESFASTVAASAGVERGPGEGRPTGSAAASLWGGLASEGADVDGRRVSEDPQLASPGRASPGGQLPADVTLVPVPSPLPDALSGTEAGKGDGTRQAEWTPDAEHQWCQQHHWPWLGLERLGTAGFALMLVMGLTGAVQARRALVKLLLTAAAAYSVVVRLHRDSQDSEVIAAFRKVLRKARPDKGGADEHAKQLNAAKERWDQMPVVSEMRHPKGFSFQQERRIVLLREATQSDGSHMEWSEIAKKVKNLLGKRPRPRHVANTYRRAPARRGPLKYDYKKCGKKPDKVTKEVERFLVKKLKELRCRTACTSTTLQLLLASEMKVKVTVRYVRKVLSKKGFRWLPKRQKRLYSKDQRKARLTFAKKVLRMTSAELNTALAYAMDGVILAMPPKGTPDSEVKSGRGSVFEVVSEMRHPKSFSFQQERRIVLLREATQSDGSHMEWSEIAKKYDYKKCGKKPDNVTKEVERFLVKKLKELRCRTACTSTTLQLLLASEMKVKVTVRYVRKVLSKKGFRWLPKRQKRLYSKDQRKARLTFAKKVLRMTSAELNTALAYAMDGVILAMPPKAKLMKRVCREVVRKKGAATGF